MELNTCNFQICIFRSKFFKITQISLLGTNEKVNIFLNKFYLELPSISNSKKVPPLLCSIKHVNTIL